MAATHFLESRGQASSAGLKRSHARQPLTNWRAEDRHRQRARNVATHGSHSLTGEPRTGVVSGLETQPRMAATHFLESRGQASSAGSKRSHARQPLTDWRAEDSPRQRVGTQPRMAATHKLESRGQALSAGLKRSHPRQPLTSWRAKDRRRQRARNAATHGSHSLPGEPRTGVVSGLETQPSTAATHNLESPGQASSARLKRSKEGSHPPSEKSRKASSAGFKHSGARQPLTCCRAEHQHSRVSLSEKRE